MASTLYEPAFITSPLTDRQLDRLRSAYDVVSMTQQHHASTTVIVHDVNSFGAAIQVATDHLRSEGVEIHGFDPDFVHLTEAARRLGITKQTLSQHTQKSTFPMPFTTSPLVMWLWGDIARWSELSQCGRLEDPDEYFPTRAEIAAALTAVHATNAPTLVS